MGIERGLPRETDIYTFITHHSTYEQYLGVIKTTDKVNQHEYYKDKYIKIQISLIR